METSPLSRLPPQDEYPSITLLSLFLSFIFCPTSFQRQWAAFLGVWFTALDAVQTAAQAANATGGAINAITVGTDGTTVTVTAGTIANDFKANFEMFYTSSSVTSAANGSASITIPVINNFENSSYKNGANWYATDALATAANANYKAGWNAVG